MKICRIVHLWLHHSNNCYHLGFLEILKKGTLDYISKFDMPKSITYLNQTPTIEWYAVRYDSNNIYHIDTCLEEVGLCAQNMITILGSIVYIIFIFIFWGGERTI